MKIQNMLEGDKVLAQNPQTGSVWALKREGGKTYARLAVVVIDGESIAHNGAWHTYDSPTAPGLRAIASESIVIGVMA